MEKRTVKCNGCDNVWESAAMAKNLKCKKCQSVDIQDNYVDPEAEAKAKAEAEAKAKNPEIEIVKATYGAGSKSVDVTEKVKELHVHKFKGFKNYNAHFGGDPVPGKCKVLSITFTVNGEEETRDFSEIDSISLE